MPRPQPDTRHVIEIETFRRPGGVVRILPPGGTAGRGRFVHAFAWEEVDGRTVEFKAFKDEPCDRAIYLAVLVRFARAHGYSRLQVRRSDERGEKLVHHEFGHLADP